MENPSDPEATRCIDKLLAVLDTQVPAPVRLVDRPFLLAIEGIYSIEGRGTVVTGRIEQGTVKVGQKVEVVGLGGLVESVVTSVEAFKRPEASAEAGENVGVLLRGVKPDQVERGMVVAAPRSIQPRASSRRRFTSCVRMKVEGGRRSSTATSRSSTSGPRT